MVVRTQLNDTTPGDVAISSKAHRMIDSKGNKGLHMQLTILEAIDGLGAVKFERPPLKNL